MGVGKNEIRTAFGRFDVCGLKPPDNLIYSPLELREAMADEWEDLFKYTEPSLFLAAVPWVLKNCKWWPKPSDMMAAIDEIKRSTLAAKRREEPKQEPTARELDPNVKRLIADVLHNHTFAQTMDVEKDVIDEARAYFPHMSGDLIRKNYPEFCALADQRERILNNQNERGHRQVPRLDPRGFVMLDTIYVS